jgi:uncharacterized membrane protein
MNELNRIEHVIGAILRAGVALSAAALIAGLVMTYAGSPLAPHLLNGGLVLLMMIPTSRILASLVDAIYRRDRLLAFATAIVSGVIAWQVIAKISDAILRR